MFERTLGRFRSLIHSGEYLLSIHALEEMAEDDILTADVENVILTGSIVERQIDGKTRERKYVFNGSDLVGDPVGLVAKIGAVGKAVVITVYREEEAWIAKSAARRPPRSRRQPRASVAVPAL